MYFMSYYIGKVPDIRKISILFQNLKMNRKVYVNPNSFAMALGYGSHAITGLNSARLR